MEVLKGIAVSPGVAISTAYILGRQKYVVPTRLLAPSKVGPEMERFRRAVASAAREIHDLKNRLAGTPAERYGAILDAHLAMLTDERLSEEISKHIREERYNAEHAVTRVLAEYARSLESVEDDYLRQRASDIYDIERRLLDALTGNRGSLLEDVSRPVVVIAHDLTPGETLSLDRQKVSGFATDVGGSTSHTAIVAKALSIPAVVALGRASTAVAGGDTVIVDGNKGLLVIDPDAAAIERYNAARADAVATDLGLADLKDLPAETSDGRRISLLGNIELPEEIPAALANGAEGIGLFRTEFLFLKAGHEPSEEEQFLAYVNAAKALGDRPLVIRTFDLGGDKVTGEMKHHLERNPSLGCRSIRFCLENPALFRAQIRAIVRASIHGDIRLLFPMISSLEELRRAKAFYAEVVKDLRSKHAPIADRLKVGIMVEVPSVAIAPDAFAAEVDFFSIGTNDLIQYTLAVERVNQHVAWLFTPAHPAILRLVRNVVEVSQRLNVPASVCGEMSGDPLFTMFLVGVGISELSIAPRALPRIKQVIRSISYEHAKKVAQTALALASARDVKALLLKELPEHVRATIA